MKSEKRSLTRSMAVVGWLRLARVFQKIDTLSARLFQQYGLTTAQFDVLAKLGASAGMTQQELAASLLVTKGNVSQVLDRMEQRGLIVRRQEGRTKYLFLTEQGQALFEAAVPQQEAHINTLMAALTLDEQAQLVRLLRKIDQSLD
ncbi:MAG TPA: MarR family transcriptional regulator [Roseiflexaceae bacterium]|jgi:DNA-binding MarR family transcriptional regulator|nr:MarR family transcriptional regulator [Roseiflexaceae bacterium]